MTEHIDLLAIGLSVLTATRPRSRILLIDHDRRAARDLLDRFASELGERVMRYHRSNGNEHLDLSDGGRIDIASPRSDRLRGVNPTVVIATRTALEHGLDLAPLLATGAALANID